MRTIQLSKSESKYRIKIIQAWHYDKMAQNTLDRYVLNADISYKSLYQGMRKGYVYSFMAEISTYRLSRAVREFGISCQEATNVWAEFGRKFKKNCNSRGEYIDERVVKSI